MIRDGKIVGATLLGDSKKLAFLQQAFDRGLPLPEERVQLLFDLAALPPKSRWPSSPMTHRSATATASASPPSWTPSKGMQDGLWCHGRDPSRKGLWLVQGAGRATGRTRRRWRRRGRPVGPLLRAWHPGTRPHWCKPRAQDLRSVAQVFAALAPDGEEDAKSKMGLASLLKVIWGADAPDDREGRFINDRVHANIQKDGTFSVVPQMRGGVTTPSNCAALPMSPRSTRCRW